MCPCCLACWGQTPSQTQICCLCPVCVALNLGNDPLLIFLLLVLLYLRTTEAAMLYLRELKSWIKGSVSTALIIYLALCLSYRTIKVQWPVCDVEQLRSLGWLSPAGVQSGFEALCPVRFTDKPWSGDGGRGCISGYWGSSQLSSLAELTAGVCGFCASCSGISPREVPVLVVSEYMQLWSATSYSLTAHLQAQVFNWAQQLCAPSTFKAVGSQIGVCNFY